MSGAPRHAPRIPFALLVTGLIVGGLALLLLLNTVSAANELRRHDLAAQDASVAAQVQELGNEVADSAAPGNLARAAAQLGMVPAGNPAFLVIGADGTVRVLGSPAAASPVYVAEQAAHHSSTPTKTHKSTTPAGRHTPSKSAKSSSASKSASKSTPRPSPTPTPTPTPTVTIPGGPR